jgi:hypothetical protein
LSDTGAVHVGIADHFGWAIAVTASRDHTVADRRRVELVEPGMATAPFHHEGSDLSLPDAIALIGEVIASARPATASALDHLERALDQPVESVSLRHLPDRFPTDIETLRRPPWEARADAVMYRTVLVEVAGERGWTVRCYDAKVVIEQAERHLGQRAEEVLHGPRAQLGPPWTKDHRMALAATVVAVRSP